MRYSFLVIFLSFSVLISAQDLEIQSKIDFFNAKIQKTQKGERLKWMDSLLTIISYKPEFKYDSIARQTIDFAIDLDSLNLSAMHVANLIYYHNNIAGNPEEGFALFNTYFQKFENKINDFELGRLYLNIADSYYYSNKVDEAIDCYELSKTYALKAKDKRLLGFANLYIGYVESEMGKLAASSLSLRKANTLFEEVKDTFNILASKNALAILYSKNAFYEEAEQERNEAISIAKKSNRHENLLGLYANAAEDYKRTGNFVKQIAYLKLSLLSINEINDKYSMRPLVLASLINAYAENDSLSLAEDHFKEIEMRYLNDKSDKNRRLYIDAKKILLFAKEDYNNALILGKEHLELLNKKQKIEDIMMSEKFLSKTYNALGKKTNSNAHLLNYYKIKDSISSVQNVKSLTYYQTLYETEKRDLKIENQQASINILNLKNKNKTQLLIFGFSGLIVLFGGIIIYRSFSNIKQRELAQHKFSQELITTQEQERTRIAKDLHDGVGQQITLLKMKAQNSNQTELSGLAHNALEEVRSISRDLYPVTLAKFGLTESLEKLLLGIDEETDLFVSLEIDDVNAHFNEIDSLNVYRFIQESVSNVLKHAKAKTLIVNILKQDDAIHILIKDNGHGFDILDKNKQNSLGLKTMSERINILNGSITFKSKKGEGTSIIVQIPV